MKYLNLPDKSVRILPFYLAMEEHAAHIMGEEDMFFMWQVEPTVIFGRNQLIENEVNLPYCRQHGISYYRRKSGGGCVYADMNNIMFSYISRSDNVEFTFERYTDAVEDMLRALGLNASSSGRNDILIDGMKVSGNAFYHLPGRSIVHGTMLYDSDMTHIVHAITPSRAKLVSKGVDSVQSRITTIRQHCDIGLEAFKSHARQWLCQGETTLTAQDVDTIDGLMQDYLQESFILGNNPRCSVEKHGRIEGVGELVVNMELNRNIIKQMNVAGDYFLLGDLDEGLIKRLQGVALTREALEQALEPVPLSSIIMNLNKNDFINLLTS